MKVAITALERVPNASANCSHHRLSSLWGGVGISWSKPAGSSITPGDLPVRVTARAVGAGPAARSLDAMEKSHIEQVLQETEWNITRSAKILGVDRGTLYNKIRKYGLRSPEVAHPGTLPR